MHRLRTALCALPLLAAAAPVSAQSVLETVWSDARTVPGDLFHVWSAPARIRADDVPPLVLFLGATTLVAVNDLEIQQWVRAHPRSLPILLLEPFRHEHDGLSRIGQNHWMLRGAAVGYIGGLATGQEWLRESALGCAVGNTSNALPRKAVYSLVARRRPSNQDDAYDIDVPGGGWGVHSFFGGHAANAFTCASFIAHRWDLDWGEPVVWAIAAGVASARTADEAHWASDTLSAARSATSPAASSRGASSSARHGRIARTAAPRARRAASDRRRIRARDRRWRVSRSSRFGQRQARECCSARGCSSDRLDLIGSAGAASLRTSLT